ncbi:Ubiquinone/menaquinone biosynthesis C-methyltransferase UbiE [Candidatus Thermoflexus japonica]|uniref:Ubiquinone/menaquinone biosynthesis C-methyltransferase UbiE n=1 Tax=Candidatus Thermoflexus japonica TaxID=2035417 RepID=A0A2H5Y971_9CHLR|nr:Ubiquinone/menaquinone biosynthesis C-methyltransferase UbiE [Candidatus Thermoflexus japonica]
MGGVARLEKTEALYRIIAHGFDRIAPAYDERYSARTNPVMAWMRGESWKILRRLLPPGGWVLEIGCGTGEDTEALARAGHRVLATDISVDMLRRARARAMAAGLLDRIAFVAIPAGHLAALQPPEPFDGAYAGFGALNCEPALEGLAEALSALLRPGAPFILSVIHPWCLLEALGHLRRGRFRAALRGRGTRWTLATLPGPNGERIAIPMRPLSASALQGVFAPSFRLEQAMAFPLFLPPPSMADLLRRHPALFRILEVLDRKLRARWPWRDGGDHLLVVLRRR